MKLIDTLLNDYEENEAIVLREINISSMSYNAIKMAMKRLVDEGVVKRYKNGVYYIPKKGRFGTLKLSSNQVLSKQYITDKKNIYGFYSGLKLLNEMQLTTQVPNNVEIITNNESSRKRTVSYGKQRITLKKSIVPVTKKNVNLLRLLEVIKEEQFLVLTKEEQKKIVSKLIKTHVDRKMTMEVLSKYPAVISKRLIETGVIYEIT